MTWPYLGQKASIHHSSSEVIFLWKTPTQLSVHPFRDVYSSTYGMWLNSGQSDFLIFSGENNGFKTEYLIQLISSWDTVQSQNLFTLLQLLGESLDLNLEAFGPELSAAILTLYRALRMTPPKQKTALQDKVKINSDTFIY